jgi:SAM-dependent methyltransferase
MKAEKKFYDDIYKKIVENGDDKIGVKTHNEILNKFILDWLPDEEGKILSIGCGALYETDIFKRKKLTVYGIDISENAIKLAKRNDVKVKIGDARVKIPFQNNFFDVIYAGQVIEHLGVLGNFFQEMNRVLKKEGVLIITCPLLGFWRYRIKLLFGSDIFDDHHCRLFTISSIRSNMEKNGFILKESRVVGKLKFINKSLCGFGFFKGIKIRDKDNV